MPKIKSGLPLPQSNQHNVFVEKLTRDNTMTQGVFSQLDKMKSGDCIKFKCATISRARRVQSRISAVATVYCALAGLDYKKTFTTRIIKNGVAIFCIGQ
jgi:hypothetical protein